MNKQPHMHVWLLVRFIFTPIVAGVTFSVCTTHVLAPLLDAPLSAWSDVTSSSPFVLLNAPRLRAARVNGDLVSVVDLDGNCVDYKLDDAQYQIISQRISSAKNWVDLMFSSSPASVLSANGPAFLTSSGDLITSHDHVRPLMSCSC